MPEWERGWMPFCLTTLCSFFFDLSPCEWSVGLDFHLNVPSSRWTGKGVGDVGGVLEAPTLGSIVFRFSRVPLQTFSAAHTDLEYSTHVTCGRRLTAYAWALGVPTSGNR